MWHKLTLIGNLGKEPEMRYTPTGQAVTNLNLATTRKWSDGNGQRMSETAWFRVTVWGKVAESCNQYLHKGSKVLIEGRLNVDPSTGGPKVFTRQDGTSGASFEVTAEKVLFLSTREGDDDHAPAVESDDVPF